MLAILNRMKDEPFDKAELENSLAELNRLINLVISDQAPCIVPIEKVSSTEYIVKNTHIEEKKGEVRITKTDILNLCSYFQNHAIKKQPIEEIIEYIKIVNENRVCALCFRRASENTLLSPLVMEKREGEVLMYHIECAESIAR